MSLAGRRRTPCQPPTLKAMSETKTRRPNFWAALIAFMMLLPIAMISFENAVSPIIMAFAAAAGAAFVFPVKK